MSTQPLTLTLKNAVDLARDCKGDGVNRADALLSLNSFVGDDLAQQAVEKVYDRVKVITQNDPQQPALSFFESIALPLIERLSIPVAPCYPNDKQVHTKLVPSPLTMKSKDPAQICAWGAAEPNANVCVYAVQEQGGLCFIDKDGAVSLRAKYERETGKKFPSTLLVRSSIIPDNNGGTITKGHWYFQQTARTMALSKNISEASTGGLFSFRVKNEYVASIGSINPVTGKPYEIAEDFPVLPMPDDLLDWLLKQTVDEKPTAVTATGERRLIQRGQMHPAYVAEAGRLWNRGYEAKDVVEMTARWMVANGEPPVDENKVRKEALNVTQIYKRGEAPESAALVLNQQPSNVFVASEVVAEPTEIIPEVSPIPEFDDSAITGIYRKIVDAACKGTTIPRQNAFLAGRVYVGAMIAGKVKFEGMADTSSYYGVMIGVSGTSKGLAWERVVKDILVCGETIKPSAVKIIEGSGDSGAGLMDFFFDSPKDAPVICMIDEVAELGHKSSAEKQPEILDTIVRLATKHEFTRVKASKSHKASAGRHHDNAHLSLYMCAQNREVIASAFPNKRGMGIYERFYCEYSPPVIPGRLPRVDPVLAREIWGEVQKLQRTGSIAIGDGVEDAVDAYWAGLPPDIQTLVRLKSHLMRDVFINAHGRGSSVAEWQDWVAAEKNFQRFLKIKAEFFNLEIPDKIGLFIARLKDVMEAMRKQLNDGKPVAMVAMSLRDIQTAVHAHRDNQLHTFKSAWSSFSEYVHQVSVKAANKQAYTKFIPAPEMDEEWWLKTSE